MSPSRSATDHLDLQARLGISQHTGGYEATDELLAMCHLDDGARVLEVGCGIGVGAVYLARARNCQVTAVDCSPQMIAWAKQRAAEAGVAYRIEFRVADVNRLPFDDGAFDVVVAESALSFVADKPAAIAELVRVVKPGGRVGIGETFWIADPPAECAADVQQLGGVLLNSEAWQALWAASGLDLQDSRFYSIERADEVKSRRRWIGWKWLLKSWGRLLGLWFGDRAAYQRARRQSAAYSRLTDCMGFGLFIGQKK